MYSYLLSFFFFFPGSFATAYYSRAPTVCVCIRVCVERYTRKVSGGEMRISCRASVVLSGGRGGERIVPPPLPRVLLMVGWRRPGREERRFRERIESGRGRAHCICGMTFVVLSLATCDAVAMMVAGRGRGGCRRRSVVDSCVHAPRYQCSEGHVLRENSPSLRYINKHMHVCVRINICHMALPPTHAFSSSVWYTYVI